MDKQTILDEIRRTAADNGGTPLGRKSLEIETGIKEHHWKKYWAKFTDAQREAGLSPNIKTQPIGRERLIMFLIDLCRELDRFPTHAEIRVKSASDAKWPSHRVFDHNLGTKAQMVSAVASYCRNQPGYEDVLTYCNGIDQTEHDGAEPNAAVDGYVYMLKSGRFYKIGKTNHVGRRDRELAVQLPEVSKMVHFIKTDDPDGIEGYWHRRFAAQRQNGEWFKLGSAEIAAFRRRKFM